MAIHTIRLLPVLRFSPAVVLRSSVLVMVALGGLVLSSLPLLSTPAAADDGSLFTPVAWKSAPLIDSVEMGDHSLNMNFNFKLNSVVSSAAHRLRQGSNGTASGYSVLLRTSSDATTRKLPPTTAAVTGLGSLRAGLTPSSTLVEGSTGGLRLTSQVTKPYIPSGAVDDLGSQLTNGPFMYVRLQVTNTAQSAKPASALYVGFGSSCGVPLQGSPRAGWRTLRMCNGGDAGGTRYLAVPATAGSTWGTGTGTVADFKDDGKLGGGDGTGNTAVGLPVPALAAGASYRLTLVYGAWNEAAGLTSPGGARYPFYYRRWWSSPTAMLNFAIDNTARSFDGAAAFDGQVRAVSSDTGAQFGAVHAFRGWRHDNWLVSKPDGGPFFAVNEGAFDYLSTVDVAYDYQPFQTRYEPWKSRLELDEWAAHYEVDGSGRTFVLHDLGVGIQLTAGAAYDLKSGVRRHMPVEHNADMVAMILAWQRRTGQTYDDALVKRLLDAAESHDSNADGSIDVSSMLACLPGGSPCRTSELGTTYDSPSLSEANRIQAGNTVLTAKLGVVESFAGAAWATRARRHLDEAEAFSDRLSSDERLDGHDRRPAYLADAVLYATVLGSNAVLDDALPWLNAAMVDNQAVAQGSAAATAIAPVASGESLVWISKALDGDAVGAWIRRVRPSWTALRPEGPKLWATWNKRISGTGEGTFDFATYPSNAFKYAGWYPRSASIWAAAPPA